MQMQIPNHLNTPRSSNRCMVRVTHLKINERQKKELDQLKIKHDREDDRARAQDTSRKNRQSTTDESLWANIHKKRQRIKQGSGEKMRKVGDKGAPTPDQMKRAKGESVTEEMKCPPATQDLKINTKNRDATIKNFNYDPLNVDEPGDYWKDIAKYWKTTEEQQKKSLCGNCVAFDISPRMEDCMPGRNI